jgi:coproporphyrinogen III oxidase-like Fe-S oxidoreductase
MGLRLAEGIDLKRYAQIAARPLQPERVAALRQYGFIEITPTGRLRVTLRGFPLLDSVVADLAA